MTKSSIIPQNLTPLQRARLKLITLFILIAVFNGVLAGITVLTSFNGGTINWQPVYVSALSQAVLAVLEALRKYFTASGEPSYADIANEIKAEVQAHTPAAPLYSANEQALQSSVNTLLNPVSTAPVTSSAQGIKPANIGIPDTAGTPTTTNTVDTLPILVAVKNRPQN